MKRKFEEWLSVQLAKNPGRMVLLMILFFNIIFVLVSSVIINNLALTGTEQMGFLQATYCTITMILDAGCISSVVEDIGTSGVAVALICLGIVIVGMISFTGAVIGYVTNYISSFIENANDGNKKFVASNHVVILNWNTRASEIINDLLYADGKQKVVVLVNSRKEEIEKEINERLSDTIARENAEMFKRSQKLSGLKRANYIRKHLFKNNIFYVVKEGDVFSSKQLRDISLEHAKMVVILGNDINNSACKFEQKDRVELAEKGNSQTVKTLMQVADITSSVSSDDNQKIIVEINDDWTAELVNKIINYKQVDKKCNIVPIYVNRVLGQILSQFSLMPELNLVYKELFSNKGASFFTKHESVGDEIEHITEYLKTHKNALPLTQMEHKGDEYFCYAANSEKDVEKCGNVEKSNYTVNLNRDYWIEQKNVIILGHNSKCEYIMKGFEAFTQEWHSDKEQILRIVVIDDKKNLEKMNYYKDYPFVIETVAANIYDREIILSKIEEFVSSNSTDTSVLILSDDSALNEDVDANALANLIYVQDIINKKIETEEDFDPNSIDVVVEIIDPKHHDIVNTYSVNNVVISNRYISKMITQIGEKESLYDFYCDILTYDTDDSDGYDSKEIYAKKVSRFFNEVPKKCTSEEFVRAVFEASIDESIPAQKRNPTITLGYVKQNGEMFLFSGNQSNKEVEIDINDKLIVFSNH